jgi:serine-type D-Ala-D-Ala carboxypeptidase/endopeptidase (penicillin-binding protein 4)
MKKINKADCYHTISLHRFVFFVLVIFTTGFYSCTVNKQVSKAATTILLKDSAVATGHIGICIYEPATNKYWYNYNSSHYFIPASNTKLFTLYAGMKYLGDSLVGARLGNRSDSSVTVYPTGDPTFLNPEFKFQPLFNELKSFKNIFIDYNSWDAEALGNGWAWNDYNESYMAERSPFPIYGNLIKFSLNNDTIKPSSKIIKLSSLEVFESPIRFSAISNTVFSKKFAIERDHDSNIFFIKDTKSSFKENSIPFKTSPWFVFDLLKDTLKINRGWFMVTDPKTQTLAFPKTILHSQPTDSLFKPMMHRSDNFFAEQTLLMASNEYLGYMNDAKIIDTILNTDLKDVPQHPKWVDGSGLSRYNLFTPQSFVYLLNKMKNEFGLERMKTILPTGGEGTLSAYYKKEAGFIFAKTGTLSNNCALSGYLITNKGKLLIFSILTNNYITGATPIRKAAERFLQGIREKY